MNIQYAITYLNNIILSSKNWVIMSFSIAFFISWFTDKFTNDPAIQEAVTILTILSFISCLFMIVDFITGVIASKKEGEKIQSCKMGSTIGKLVGLFFFFVLALVIIFIIPISQIVLTVIFGPIILTILKEFVSIGENLERKIGKKVYIFTLIDKIFSIFELNFLKFFKKKSSGDDIK